jgi:hypothetical protein
MSIQYIEPLSRGFVRMKKALFKPVDVQKWFIVGFTAFLAGLTEYQGNSVPTFWKNAKVNMGDVLYFPQRAWEWLENHPVWTLVIVVVLFFLFIIGTVFTWLHSRAKFMFLDNVVHDRSYIVAPWYEYRKEGNSLFLWFFCYGLIVFAIVCAYIYQCFTILLAMYERSHEDRALIFPVILAILGFIAITMISGFITRLLFDFVVPIMYRNRITTWKAIQQFFQLFFSKFIYFVGYALFVLIISILIGIGITIAGCCTCCIGFFFLAIPYINTVILLPIPYTLRAFSVEFLEQFGPEYRIFPGVDAGSPGCPPIPA